MSLRTRATDVRLAPRPPPGPASLPMPSKKRQPELPLHVAAEAALVSSEPMQREVAEETSFEDAMERLSQIVEALESAGLPVEEALGAFDERVHMARKFVGP